MRYFTESGQTNEHSSKGCHTNTNCQKKWLGVLRHWFSDSAEKTTSWASGIAGILPLHQESSFPLVSSLCEQSVWFSVSVVSLQTTPISSFVMRQIITFHVLSLERSLSLPSVSTLSETTAELLCLMVALIHKPFVWISMWSTFFCGFSSRL